MRALLSCAVALLTIPVCDAHEDVESLHLLQTSFAKVSEHSEKKCNAAKRKARDAKKKLKESRLAAKTARNAAKAANQVMKDFQTAEAEAKAEMESECPPPEVDMSPDQGCSDTLVSSYVLGLEPTGQRVARDLVIRGTMWAGPQGLAGIKEVVPGGGLPAGQGTVMGSKLGVSVMQPCSVAWTAGTVNYAHNFNVMTGQYQVIQEGGLSSKKYDMVKKKANVATACECRQWADTVVKFPKAAAIQFQFDIRRGSGECQVWSKFDELEWTQGGFQLTTVLHNPMSSMTFSCYLGNPEEWKQRLAAEREAGMTMNKCSKTRLWASGQLVLQQDTSRGYVTHVPLHHVGTLSSPDPLSGTEGGRKLCLKWVKNDAKCSGAVAIQLQMNGQCNCCFSTPGIGTARAVPRPESFSDGSRNGFPFESCIL